MNSQLYQLHPFTTVMNLAASYFGVNFEINPYRNTQQQAKKYPCMYYFILSTNTGDLNPSARKYTASDVIEVHYLTRAANLNDFCKQNQIEDAQNIQALTLFMRNQLLAFFSLLHNVQRVDKNLLPRDLVLDPKLNMRFLPQGSFYVHEYGKYKETGVVMQLNVQFDTALPVCCEDPKDLLELFKPNSFSRDYIENL